jgi:hypothetical protein
MTLLTWLAIVGAIAAGNTACYLTILAGKLSARAFGRWYFNRKYPAPVPWGSDRPLA